MAFFVVRFESGGTRNNFVAENGFKILMGSNHIGFEQRGHGRRLKEAPLMLYSET